MDDCSSFRLWGAIPFKRSTKVDLGFGIVSLDSAAESIFVVILVELTNTVNSTNITTNIETAALSNSGQLSSEREY